MKPSKYARRYPPTFKLNWLRKYAVQLDFFDVIRDNDGQTGTPVLKHQAPPNQSGGDVSTMISSYDSGPATPPQVTQRATYPRDWPSYNLAQQNEKERFLVLLRDLCSTVPQPPQTQGRPRLPLADMLFAATFSEWQTVWITNPLGLRPRAGSNPATGTITPNRPTTFVIERTELTIL